MKLLGIKDGIEDHFCPAKKMASIETYWANICALHNFSFNSTSIINNFIKVFDDSYFAKNLNLTSYRTK